MNTSSSGTEPPRPIRQDFINEWTTDQGRQKLVKDDPLVMPPQLARRSCEHIVFRHAATARVLHERVVRLQHRQVHLRHQRVRIVPWIADDRDALGIAGYVGVINTEQKFRRVVALEQERVTDRAVAVQTFQVQLTSWQEPFGPPMKLS